MKKSFHCYLFAIGTLSSCRSENKEIREDVEIKVMLVDGAPLLSMTNMMSDEFAGIDA